MRTTQCLWKTAQFELCLGKTPSSFASCQNRFVSAVQRLAGRCPRRGKQAAPAESSVIRLHTSKREIISAQFFLSNNFRIIFRIRNIDAHDEWWWLSHELEHFDKIREVLKYFQKQRVLVGTSNILEGLDISDFFLTSKDAFFDKDFFSRWLRLENFSHSPRIWFFHSLRGSAGLPNAHRALQLLY